jgi:uncharacterized protein DUF11
MRVLTRPLVTLVLLVGVLAGSGDAATGSPATQALAHLEAFDESLANLRVDLTAPLVVTTQTPQRLHGLGGLIGATLPLVKEGFPGASAALMLGQAKEIQSGLTAAAKAQGAAQVRDLAAIAAAEAPLEAEVAAAAAAPSTAQPLALVRGATNFGVQALGSQMTSTETFENALGAPVAISSVLVTGTGFDDVRDSCNGTTLAPLATCNVTIAFAPSAGSSTATLSVQDNATSMPEQDYQLTGSGIATGSAQVVVKTGASPSPLASGAPVAFPERTALSSFATAGERLQSIQLVNVGTTSANFDDVTIAGANARDFILSSARGPHGCEDATLAPGGQCFVFVEVRAARYTRQLKASLVVTGSHTGGLAPVPLTLTQADLALGSLVATSAPGQVTYRFGITNGGPDPAERTEIDAKVTSTAGPLRLVNSVPEGCAYSAGILTCAVGTLPAHATTLVTVVFAVPKGGKLTNEAAVQSLDFDPTPANDVKTLVK